MPDKKPRISSTGSRFNPFGVSSKVVGLVEMSINDSDIVKIATTNCDERSTTRTIGGPNPSRRIRNHQYPVEKRSRSLERIAVKEVKGR
jgi:hypothetical protein